MGTGLMRSGSDEVQVNRRQATMNALLILFGRVLLASARMTAYVLVFGAQVTAYVLVSGVQVTWYLLCREPARIGDAVGNLGRCSVDAFIGIFGRR